MIHYSVAFLLIMVSFSEFPHPRARRFGLPNHTHLLNFLLTTLRSYLYLLNKGSEMSVLKKQVLFYTRAVENSSISHTFWLIFKAQFHDLKTLLISTLFFYLSV